MYPCKQVRIPFPYRKSAKIRYKLKFQDIQKKAHPFILQSDDMESSNIIDEDSYTEVLNEKSQENSETLKYKSLKIVTAPLEKSSSLQQSPEKMEENNPKGGCPLTFNDNFIISPEILNSPLHNTVHFRQAARKSLIFKNIDLKKEILDDFERMKAYKFYYSSGNIEEVIKKLKKRKKGRVIRICPFPHRSSLQHNLQHLKIEENSEKSSEKI